MTLISSHFPQAPLISSGTLIKFLFYAEVFWRHQERPGYIKKIIYLWPCLTTCEILVPQPGIEPVPPALEVQSLDCRGHPNLGTFLSQFSPLEKTQFHVRHLWAQIFHPLYSIQSNKCLSSIYTQQESIRNNWLQVTGKPTYRIFSFFKNRDSFFSCEKFRRHSASVTGSLW